MSMVEANFSRLSCASRAISWNGGSMTKSASPVASAAIRVASDWITA